MIEDKNQVKLTWKLNMHKCWCSVRVSNELGASHPKAAKFSAVVVVITSFLIGLFLGLILIVTAKQYPSWFSTDDEVIEIVYKLTPLLVICIVVLNVQLPLAGTYIFKWLINSLVISFYLFSSRYSLLSTNSTAAGVAIGAGWQAYVAYVNLGCYYLVGIPLSLLMAFMFNMGVKVHICPLVMWKVPSKL